MKHILIFLICFSTTVYAQFSNTGRCLNTEETQLLDVFNQYRIASGKPSIPNSFSLSSVAQWHTWDIVTNNPVTGSCNLHSWSTARPSLWTPVCYLPDHSNATGMWHKPREITGNIYTGFGYEISTRGILSPQNALQNWINSAAHNDVMLNNGVWAQLTWRAVGIGYSGTSANIWFGEQSDPAGQMPVCVETPIFANSFEK